jgi:nitroreductase
MGIKFYIPKFDDEFKTFRREMNTFDAILNRRSIRQYKTTPVPDEYFEKLIKAAMYAPSAMNLQPWDFLIFNTPETIELCIQSVPHGENILKQSPSAILVCGDNNIEKNTDYIIQNCSAAVENILLQAYEMGLGTCWIAVYPLQDVISSLKKNFNLPGGIIPVALISIGFPAEEKTAEERYRKEKIHYNKW